MCDNKFNFKKLIFPSKINLIHKWLKKYELLVKIPEICPICGNKNIKGFFKIHNNPTTEKENGIISIQPVNKFINLNICSEHISLTKINFKKEFIIYFSSFFFFIFFLFLNPLFSTIVLIIGSLYVVLSNEKKRKKLRIIYKYIYFNYLPEYTIISIKRKDWAEEFKKLNQCEEYTSKIKI